MRVGRVFKELKIVPIPSSARRRADGWGGAGSGCKSVFRPLCSFNRDGFPGTSQNARNCKASLVNTGNVS